MPKKRTTELTTREKVVLFLLSEGLSTAQVAAQLAIEPTSVQTLAQRAIKKLGANSRLHAVAIAVRNRLI